MFYAGNSNPKRKVVRKIATFYCRESEPHIERHPSHLLLLDVAGKHVVHQIRQAWAANSKGSNIVAKVRSETILKSFGEYDHWKTNVNQKGFIPVRMIIYPFNPNFC
ncbi:hypothetical protein ACOSQ2_020541 [Xanthoceras sorbifolium]